MRLVSDVKYVGGYPVIPTVAGPTEEIMSSLSNFLNRLEDLPLEQIGGDLKESVQGMRQLLASRDLNASLPLLRQSLEQINSFTATLNDQTAPRLSSVLDEAGTTPGRHPVHVADGRKRVGQRHALNGRTQCHDRRAGPGRQGRIGLGRLSGTTS